MKNKVLITGGAGYLGSVLSQELLNHDYNVVVLDNLLYKQTSLLHLCNDKNFSFIKGDVTDKPLLQSLALRDQELELLGDNLSLSSRRSTELFRYSPWT